MSYGICKGYEIGGAIAAPPIPYEGSFDWWLKPSNSVVSGGFIDTIPLESPTGLTTETFRQSSAAFRPFYIPSYLDGNPSIFNPGTNLRLNKTTSSAVFGGNPLAPTTSGTLEFLANLSAGITFFVEITGGAYNWQAYTAASGTRFRFFTNFGILETGFAYNSNIVHTITCNSFRFRYYVNGTLVATFLPPAEANLTTPRPLGLLGYPSSLSEQGIGHILDAVRCEDVKTPTQIANNYTNFWKVKYPSLP